MTADEEEPLAPDHESDPSFIDSSAYLSTVIAVFFAGLTLVLAIVLVWATKARA